MKTLFTCCLLLVVIASASSTSNFLRKLMQGQEPSRECQVMEICVWAVCSWEQNLQAPPQHCEFVPSMCHCPPETKCALSKNIQPRPGNTLIYEYRCKIPNGSPTY